MSNSTESETACLINVYAGHNDLGPVYEELPAIPVVDGCYELLSSPGLALNMAKADLIRIEKIDQPAVVLRRGGNFCIQIYADEIADEEIERLDRTVLSEFGGSLDGVNGVNGGNLALSVPSSNDIQAINSFFDGFKSRVGVEWYYANVYKNFEDPADETLLDWWVKH